MHQRSTLQHDASDKDIIARALLIAAYLKMQPGETVLVPLQGPLRFDDAAPDRFPPYAVAEVRLGDQERGEPCAVKRYFTRPNGEAGPMPIYKLKSID